MADEDSSCPTAIIMAIVNNDKSSLQTYLNYHADPSADLTGCEGDEVYDGFPKGSTLLHIAAYSAPVTLESFVAKNSSYHLLIDYGANPNVANEDGYTPSDVRSCVYRWGRTPCKLSIENPHHYLYRFRMPVI